MKPLALVALAAPFAYLVVLWAFVLSNANPYIMGFNPVQWTHRYLGDTAIRVLLATLCISPLRDITGWAPLTLIRRRIGLAAFFYAALHMLAYLGLDRGWSLARLWEDVVIRTYIMLGMASLTLMVPLALTSTNGMIRRLGRRTWDRLHWLVYPLAVLAVAHNLLMVKVIDGNPALHAGLLGALLLWRAGRLTLKRLANPAASQPAGGETSGP